MMQSVDPRQLFKQAKRDMAASEIDVKLAKIDASMDMPDWQKSMMKKQLNLQKKMMARDKAVDSWKDMAPQKERLDVNHPQVQELFKLEGRRSRR